jgi:drug/metabolite transporter (DMT)-like permease
VGHQNGRAGLGLALLTSATFGTSGSFGESLITAGWSPAAAVTARVTVAAVILTVPALISLRGQWRLMRRAAPTVATFGLVAVAGCQVAYFNAISRLSVGVALLLEYLGIVLIVGWLWLRHGQRPRRLTLIGAACALAGLALVLDLIGAQHLDPIGVTWGLVAAAGLAVFYTLSARTDDTVSPIGLAWAGMTLGAVTLLVAGASGVTSMHANTGPVDLAGHRVGWWVPVLGLALVAAVVPYVTGIAAARYLGAKLSSFVGLTEVLFAVLVAWALLGQLPTALQLAGGVFIVGGIVLVRIDELRPAAAAPQPIAVLAGEQS